MTREQAAALKVGDVVNIDGHVASVGEIFQQTLLEMTGNETGLNRGTLFYGVIAQSGRTLLLVRWNQAGLYCYEGKAVAEKTVVAAFPKRTGPKN